MIYWHSRALQTRLVQLCSVRLMLLYLFHEPHYLQYFELIYDYEQLRSIELWCLYYWAATFPWAMESTFLPCPRKWWRRLGRRSNSWRRRWPRPSSQRTCPRTCLGRPRPALGCGPRSSASSTPSVARRSRRSHSNRTRPPTGESDHYVAVYSQSFGILFGIILITTFLIRFIKVWLWNNTIWMCKIGKSYYNVATLTGRNDVILTIENELLVCAAVLFLCW